MKVLLIGCPPSPSLFPTKRWRFPAHFSRLRAGGTRSCEGKNARALPPSYVARAALAHRTRFRIASKIDRYLVNVHRHVSVQSGA